MRMLPALTLTLIATCGSLMAESTMNVAHMHLDHVATEWSETPGQLGFLPTAREEADIAHSHIQQALSHDDLEQIKVEVRNALHALDPDEQDSGPGKGYGVIAGADSAEKHMLYAAQSPGASDNIINNNLKVRNPLKNAESLAKSAVRRGKSVLAADSVATAEEDLEAMAWLINAMIHGIDENGDGSIAADKAEGGLAVATEQLADIMSAEDM